MLTLFRPGFFLSFQTGGGIPTPPPRHLFVTSRIFNYLIIYLIGFEYFLVILGGFLMFWKNFQIQDDGSKKAAV